MNARDKYLSTYRFEEKRSVPRWEFGFWAGTLQRWYEEGLPGGRQQERIMEMSPADWVSAEAIATFGTDVSDADEDVHSYFGFDKGIRAVHLNYGIQPAFDVEILEDTTHHKILRDSNGIVLKILKPNLGMPEFVDYPVHTRAEWEEFKHRYRPNYSDRLPSDWERLKADYERRDYPLCIGAGNGFFGTVRNLVGVERALTLFYDDPDWMHDMMDYLGEFYAVLYDQVLSEVKVDSAVFWEDMCYVAGPMISPATFREFMLGPYRKATGVLRDHGVDVIIVDTDGDHRRLTPLFLEAGANGFYPFEVQSHMNVVETRDAYPRLIMQGGIDKKVLSVGRDAIDCELGRKVPAVLNGGYIPHVDHAVPPDVSWENFCYYRGRLDAMLDEYERKGA